MPEVTPFKDDGTDPKSFLDAGTRQYLFDAFPAPTEPGFYADDAGQLWLRTVDGYWYDRSGETRDKDYNFMIMIDYPNGGIKAPPRKWVKLPREYEATTKDEDEEFSWPS